jgi:hypothetical protein
MWRHSNSSSSSCILPTCVVIIIAAVISTIPRFHLDILCQVYGYAACRSVRPSVVAFSTQRKTTTIIYRSVLDLWPLAWVQPEVWTRNTTSSEAHELYATQRGIPNKLVFSRSWTQGSGVQSLPRAPPEKLEPDWTFSVKGFRVRIHARSCVFCCRHKGVGVIHAQDHMTNSDINWPVTIGHLIWSARCS